MIFDIGDNNNDVILNLSNKSHIFKHKLYNISFVLLENWFPLIYNSIEEKGISIKIEEESDNLLNFKNLKDDTFDVIRIRYGNLNSGEYVEEKFNIQELIDNFRKFLAKSTLIIASDEFHDKFDEIIMLYEEDKFKHYLNLSIMLGAYHDNLTSIDDKKIEELLVASELIGSNKEDILLQYKMFTYGGKI